MLKLIQILALAALAAGCSTVDFDYPKPESSALSETQDTYLAKHFRGAGDSYPEDYAGFQTLSDGIEALSVRLALADLAEKSIDAQYYLLKKDVTGKAFVLSLLRAADRGVRVRLLLDDMFTGGYDAGLAGLDSHPNIEIRIFNPFASRSARFWDGITGFSRINRRMHNKSFTIDNQVTLIGGRNIADEYFGARKDAKFGDLDVLGIGPVVQDVSSMFDTYWKHERSAAINAFAKMPEDPAIELERLRKAFTQAEKEIMTTRYAAAVTESIITSAQGELGMFTWAPYQLAVDSPDKSISSKSATAASITTPLLESILAAKKEVLIISPYFVPGKSGVEALVKLQESGIAVTIITNSLAANNQIMVHGGYAPSRKPLLQAGIKIYEVRADATIAGSEIVAADDAKTTLHTKAFAVDRKEAFIGSFNFDPRSANINTELGVIIRSEKIATEIAVLIEEKAPAGAFEVFLNDDNKLRWRGLDNGVDVVLDKEPQSTQWQRFQAGFYRILPIDSQL
ncbi:phospholipase D family protein [Candidatus Litorirhabdus singularis]|uniref:phospholipase D family protein n=1 Tax=Candidatus Litorirhabdus singularis TaxID=2518993 RepID=UPI00242ECC4F|nr:phospholipase D family protein [Candidatus Litorirhabdus singularis]